MKPEACPICGGPLRATGVSAGDRLGPGGPFRVLECPACRLGVTDPQLTPEELAPYYEDAYYEDYYEHSGPERPPSLLQRLRDANRSRSAARRSRRPPFGMEGVPPGRVLDVGCGAGDLLASFAERGWKTYGIDPGAPAAAAAARRGAIALQGTLADRPFADQNFDLITMSHSLEHIADPLVDVRLAAARLVPGGLLAIEVPNWDCWQRRLYGKYWAPLELPRHQEHFSPQALRRLGAAARLDVREVGTSSSPISTAYSIHTMIAGTWTPGPKLWLSYLISLPLLPLVYGVDRLRGGDCCHIVLEKKA
jgi:2-polyprenyl-3-methyl-5-hydroxy-6-metoxy-1,4-benzoquinol methylase